MRSSLLRGYRTLDPVARRGLRRLGVLGLPHFPAWIVGPLSDVPEAEADAVSERLADAHVLDFVRLDEDGQLRYGVPDLTALFARERGADEDGPDELRAAFDRLLRSWTSLAERAAFPVDADAATRRQSHRWAEVERAASALLVEKAHSYGLHRAAVDLASALRAAGRCRPNAFSTWTGRVQPSVRGGAIAQDFYPLRHIDHGR